MITTAQYDLGDVQITMGREEVMGVPVLMEKRTVRNRNTEDYTVDAVYLHRLDTPLRKQLKGTYKSMAAVRSAIEQVLPQLPR